MITQERRDQSSPVVDQFTAVSARSRPGQFERVTHEVSAGASLAGDQSDTATPNANVASIVVRLIAYGRIRRQLVSFNTRTTLQLKAIERMGRTTPDLTPTSGMSAPSIALAALPIAQASTLVRPERLRVEREIVKLAKQLPAWSWVEGVRGCGALGLGLIVCETGDLSAYSNPAKLWKRLGLAVFDGRSQRRVSDAAEAIRQGYNPARRSMMHNVGDALLKQNGKDGYFRALYDERKARETELHPDLPLLQRHRRAMRYMEKRFLLHLWRAWRHAGTVAATSSEWNSNSVARNAVASGAGR